MITGPSHAYYVIHQIQTALPIPHIWLIRGGQSHLCNLFHAFCANNNDHITFVIAELDFQ